MQLAAVRLWSAVPKEFGLSPTFPRLPIFQTSIVTEKGGGTPWDQVPTLWLACPDLRKPWGFARCLSVAEEQKPMRRVHGGE